MSSELSFSSDAEAKGILSKVILSIISSDCMIKSSRILHSRHGMLTCSHFPSPHPQVGKVVKAPVKILNKVPIVGKVAAAAIPGVGPAIAIADKVSAVRFVPSLASDTHDPTQYLIELQFPPLAPLARRPICLLLNHLKDCYFAQLSPFCCRLPAP